MKQKSPEKKKNTVLSKDKNLHFDSFHMFLSPGYTNTTHHRAERKETMHVLRPCNCLVYKFRSNQGKHCPSQRESARIKAFLHFRHILGRTRVKHLKCKNIEIVTTGPSSFTMYFLPNNLRIIQANKSGERQGSQIMRSSHVKECDQKHSNSFSGCQVTEQPVKIIPDY